VRNIATGTIIDDDPGPPECAGMSREAICPELRLRAGEATVVEADSLGPRTVMFMVTMSRPAWTSIVTVPYTMTGVDGATVYNKRTSPDGDYMTKTGTLSFTGHKMDRYVFVRVMGDVAIDPGESIRITLGTPTTGANIAEVDRAEGSVVILDDDG
jgi:hypothetical protein